MPTYRCRTIDSDGRPSDISIQTASLDEANTFIRKTVRSGYGYELWADEERLAAVLPGELGNTRTRANGKPPQSH
jgi:hypothetical protein